METQVRTPQAIFGQPQRFLVPLFQRPYVWNEEQQWEPLWRDLERVANRLLLNPHGKHAPHFLGAVVLQQVQSPTGELPERVIIDGQQRLTTLQILLDALNAELRRVNATVQADRLEYLVENDRRFRKHDEDQFKVWPTNRDRAAFNEVMSASSPIDYSSLKYKDARLVKAHRFFAEQTSLWLRSNGDVEHLARADAIERSVRELLQVVVIDLGVDENAQEIFETLNARGAQLTASDLIKNFIFQRLYETGADVEKAYQEYWQDFETAFWETEVSAGRLRHQRSSLFINHWLISKTGEEIVAREVFSRFKTYADHDVEISMVDLLKQISRSATLYRRTITVIENTSGDLDRVALFSYRITAMESDVMRSVLLALLDDTTAAIPDTVVDATVSYIESWLTRRMLIRASSKSYNQVAAELVSVIRQADAARVDHAVQSFLLSQSSEHRYWPDDEEILRELAMSPIYRRVSRSRLRMVLEAIEDHKRGYRLGGTPFAGMRVPRSSYHIEHLMPQSWESKWTPPSQGTASERAQRVQALGNLTLLTQRLNSSVSNGAWVGGSGKRAALNQHDVLLMNRELDAFDPSGWSDAAITKRTSKMAAEIVEIWPTPSGYRSSTARSSSAISQAVEISDLLSAGLVTAGQRLIPKPTSFRDRFCTILPDGRIDVDGKIFDTPSGAGFFVRQRSTNGWHFWLTDITTKKSLATLRRQLHEQSSLGSVSDDESDSSD